MKGNVAKILFWFCLLIFSKNTFAQLVIEVTQGVSDPAPVAVVPFADDQGLSPALDVDTVINQNLERSGFFKGMSKDNMLSFPNQFDDVSFSDWRMLNRDYIVVGRIQQGEGRDIQVSFELIDILNERRLLGETLIVRQENMRDVGHFISDKIYEEITGIPGAFSTRMVYVTAAGTGNNQSFTLNLADWDGERSRTILQSSEPILSPSWSFDGERLAYVSFESSRPEIYIQHLATGQREKLPSFSGLNGAPAWSPDGRSLALVLSKDGNPEIYLMDMSTKQLRRVTNNSSIDTEPFWHPDGSAIYFTSDRGGSPQIYRKQLSTGSAERVTFQGSYNARGRITQDGRFITMVHRNESRKFQIAVLDLLNGRLDILSNSDYDESPSIAPNGSVVIYATQSRGRNVLSAVSLDGRVRFNMPLPGEDVREPAWSPFLN